MDQRMAVFFEYFEKLEFQPDEVPSFSMVFSGLEVLGYHSNSVQNTQFSGDHSEVLAIRNAQKERQSRYLNDCILLTSLEPCLMCGGAIVQSRIQEVWYFAEQTKIPGISSLSLEFIWRLHSFPKLVFIQVEQMEETWKKFFQTLRSK